MKTRTFSGLRVLIVLTLCAAFGILASSAFATGPTCVINGAAPTPCTVIGPPLAPSALPTPGYSGEFAGYASLPDGSTPTACVVNPPGTFTGTITANGCDIGVYYGPSVLCSTVNATPVCTATTAYASPGGVVSGSVIQGAGSFGILVSGAPVEVRGSEVSGAGLVGILYINSSSTLDKAGYGATCAPTSGKVGCLIVDNVVDLSTVPNSRAGIVAKNVGTQVTIGNNQITGYLGDTAAGQNGIEIGDGAQALIKGNTVSDFNYIGNNSDLSTDTFASGILLYGGPGYAGFGWQQGPNYTIGNTVENNTVTDCDVGVVLDNNNKTLPVTAVTNNKITNNKISNSHNGPWLSGSVVTPSTDWNMFQAAIMSNGVTASDAISKNQTKGVGLNMNTGSAY